MERVEEDELPRGRAVVAVEGLDVAARRDDDAVREGRRARRVLEPVDGDARRRVEGRALPGRERRVAPALDADDHRARRPRRAVDEEGLVGRRAPAPRRDERGA